MEILRNNQKTLEIKNIVTKMKRVLDGLVSRVDIAEKKISEFEDMTIHISKSEKQKEKNTGGEKKITGYPRAVGKLQKA